jgi:hypothetical protein
MADDKKIIIDEDWKSRVQADKEATAQKVSAEPVVSSGDKASGADAATAQDPPMPGASFEMLVTTLATEVLVALGQIPHPVSNKAEVHRGQAQYLIDTLDVLREKTKGNLSPREQQLLESVLHQIRMVFIAVATDSAAEAAT